MRWQSVWHLLINEEALLEDICIYKCTYIRKSQISIAEYMFMYRHTLCFGILGYRLNSYFQKCLRQEVSQACDNSHELYWMRITDQKV